LRKKIHIKRKYCRDRTILRSMLKELAGKLVEKIRKSETVDEAAKAVGEARDTLLRIVNR
jgi:hypothetical protein